MLMFFPSLLLKTAPLVIYRTFTQIHLPSITGQFFQTVYPAHHRTAENYNWAWFDNMHLNETSEYATDNHRMRLYHEWRPHWNVSRPILMEKSPRHALMTRLLQHWFTPERSYFIVLLRHPLATLRLAWEDNNTKLGIVLDCGDKAIQHWLHIVETLFSDLNHLRNVILVQFERLALGDTQGNFGIHICVYSSPMKQKHKVSKILSHKFKA